jgi:hypothetical protein
MAPIEGSIYENTDTDVLVEKPEKKKRKKIKVQKSEWVTNSGKTDKILELKPVSADKMLKNAGVTSSQKIEQEKKPRSEIKKTKGIDMNTLPFEVEPEVLESLQNFSNGVASAIKGFREKEVAEKTALNEKMKNWAA